MSSYVPLKQASEMFGVHPDSIRRLWRDKNKRVIPEMQAKITQKDRQGRVLVDTEYLKDHFKPYTSPVIDEPNADDKAHEPAMNSGTDTTLKALTDQLKAKDEQIAQLHALLSKNEDNTTLLQDQYQRLLKALLPENTPSKTYESTEDIILQKPTVVETEPTPTNNSGKKNKKKKGKQPKPVKKVSGKKRWWKRK